MFSVVVDMVVGAMVGQSPDTCGEVGAQSSERSAPKGADHQARLVVSQVFPVPRRRRVVHGDSGSDLVMVTRHKQGVKMNGYKLRTALEKLMPNYSIDEDNEGQIIIYTNLTEGKNDTYVEMED